MAKTFEVRTKSGNKIHTHRVVAASPEEARKLCPSDDPVVSIRKQNTLLTYRALSASDRITLLRRLAMMTRSGVGLSRALLTIKDSFTGPISRAANDIMIKVSQGDDFDEVLANMPADFPPTTVSLIRSGMHGGEIYKALNSAAEFEIEMHTIGISARGGMTGAAIEFVIAIGLILVTAYWAAPEALKSPIYSAAGDSVNIGWAFLLADIMAIFSLAIVVFLLTLFLVSFVFKPLAPNFSDAFTLKIPVFRDLVLSKNYYSVFYGLSLLVASGVRLKIAMSLAYQSAPAGAIAQDLKNAIEAIDRGDDWGVEMKRLHPTDRACLSTSQDRADIAEAFNVVAMGHRENYKQRVGQVVPALSALSNTFMFMAGFLIFAMLMLPTLQATRGML